MALLPKKTYSRRNNELSFFSEKEKENTDPFDELLSSPLKQEVQFKPLSFWGKKVKDLESKEKPRKVDCGLFEASDSDEINSPCNRRGKPKTKQQHSKARSLQPKSRSKRLNDKRKNYSTSYSCIKKSKELKPVIINKIATSVVTEEFEKSKCCSLNSCLSQHETLEETSLCNNSCNISQFTTPNRCINKTYVINRFGDLNNNFEPIKWQRDCKNNLNSPREINFSKSSNLSFRIYEDTNTTQEEYEVIDNKTVIHSKTENSANSSMQFNESLDKTLTPVHSGRDSFMFVNRRRPFRYQNCISVLYKDLYSSNSFHCYPTSSFLREEFGGMNSSNDNSEVMDVTLSEEALQEDESNLSYSSSCPTQYSLHYNDSTSKMFYVEKENAVPCESGEWEKLYLPDCKGDESRCDWFGSLLLSETELEDLLLELQNGNLDDGAVESSSTSDDTLSSYSHEDTVIKIGLNPKPKDASLTDSGVEKDTTQSSFNAVSALTTGISDLSIANAKDIKKTEENENISNDEHDSNYEDNTFSVNFRNVTTRRRGVLNDKYDNNSFSKLSSVNHRKTKAGKEIEGEMELEQSLLITGRKSLDWNQTISFANPVFESTRVFDMDSTDKKEQRSQLEDTGYFHQDHTYSLKPGKKWLRSMSVLKQIQNGSIAGDRLESTRITGRKFESFVQDMLDIQNEKSEFFTTLVDATNKTVMGATLQTRQFPGGRRTILELEKSHLENSSVSGSVSSISLSNNTMLEKSSLNLTVKVIDPEAGPSAFRSALGIDINRSGSQKDFIQEESSSVSARDFILMQCGQDDVLPFEEYFNEKTLKNCRKIGEGVYGEVFMTSDAVIKIIPIEGADKVNGEPQKTFEEIMSEVVIAAKLSNLRRGEKHRTDGFSELKRCWCVKGKYPKYLMQLWDEYDQTGSGSENDSPIMFKNDQLYIILELANGGKDLESYVFTSSAQSLSIYIQIACSLAVAEKAFEFEHRDLHWGNVLISGTKDKFASVVLDGIEYKVPTKGVKVCIIDFTLSRINHEGCCIFNDLSVDPTLFASEGDYQFEIYRLMLREVKNDWSLFRPKTNLFWLHYTVDKMIKMVHYKNKKTKIHAKHLSDLKLLECAILEHKDCTDFVLSDFVDDKRMVGEGYRMKSDVVTTCTSNFDGKTNSQFQSLSRSSTPVEV